MTIECLSEEDLWELLEGPSADGSTDSVASHVETCAACRGRLDELRRIHTGLATIGHMSGPAVPERIGAYTILRQIGEGGMGVVYEARRDDSDPPVALKVLRPVVGGSGRRVRIFQREIQVLSRLRHPSIGRIHDVGHTPDGAPFFVMELVNGRSLVDHCTNRDLSLRDR